MVNGYILVGSSYGIEVVNKMDIMYQKNHIND